MNNKKILLPFLLILISAGFFMGCESTKTDEKTFITMRGNPTTGYDWQYTIDNEEIVSVDCFTMYVGEGNMTGAPSDYRWVFNGLKKGSTVVHFKYCREWEKDVPPIDTKDYLVNVDKDLNVTVKEK